MQAILASPFSTLQSSPGGRGNLGLGKTGKSSVFVHVQPGTFSVQAIALVIRQGAGAWNLRAIAIRIKTACATSRVG
jgi:hypothetical protein